MLTQFFNEWNQALANERVTKTQTDAQGNVVWQNSIVVFRDTQIQVHRKSLGDNSYTAELFVPSTNKFISNKKFTSQAKCAEAILLALIPGYDKDETRRLRAEKKAQQYCKQLSAEQIAELRQANMDQADFEWFCALINREIQAGNSYNTKYVAEVVAKWYPALVGDAAYLHGFSDRDIRLHVARMFELAAMILQRKIKVRNGFTIRGHYAAKLFRTVPDGSVHLPPGILEVKRIYREIDQHLNNNSVFLYFVQVLSDFYEQKLHITTQQILAAAEERRNRSRERRLRAMEGYENHGTITVLGQAQGIRKPAPKATRTPAPAPAESTSVADQAQAERSGMKSIGSAFGEQLDALDLAK